MIESQRGQVQQRVGSSSGALIFLGGLLSSLLHSLLQSELSSALTALENLSHMSVTP